MVSGTEAGSVMSRFLVIDDDDEYRFLLCEIFRRRGHAAVEAGRARDGIRMIDAEAFDGLVVDLVMPELDGIETLRLVRDRHPQMPILCVSGGCAGEFRPYLRAALAFGANLASEKTGRIADAVDELIALTAEGRSVPAGVV